jgi:hypothetical protein
MRPVIDASLRWRDRGGKGQIISMNRLDVLNRAGSCLAIRLFHKGLDRAGGMHPRFVHQIFTR